jgi:hypothetical protein
MASFARIHSGPAHALDSRYTTVGVVLVISMIGLVAAGFARERTGTGQNKRSVIMGMAVGMLLILYAINIPFELRYLRLNKSFRERGKVALEFSAVLDLDQMCRAALLIREDPETLARCLNVIDRLKLLDPPRRQTAVVVDAENRPERATDEYGVFETLGSKGDVLVAIGWAYLPADAGPPAGVVLAYRNGADWKAFALSDVTQSRPDLRTKYGRNYLGAGWLFGFPRELLPLGEQEITAWALEAENGRTYRLPGSFLR